MRATLPFLLLGLLLLTVPHGFAAQPGTDLPEQPVTDDYGPLQPPVLVQSFEFAPSGYLLGIAWDGEFYWVIDGGAGVPKLRQFASDGTLLNTADLGVDARGIVHNPLDGRLYLSGVGGDVFRVLDPMSGSTTLMHEGLLQDTFASLGMAEGGGRLFDMDDGTCAVHGFFSGELLYLVDGLNHGNDYLNGANAIAVDTDYLYTWDADAGTLYVQSSTGGLLASYQLPYGDFGPSLAFTNHLLWVAQHTPDGTYGEWFGYRLRDWSDGPVDFTLTPSQSNIPPGGGTITYAVTLASNVPQTVPGLSFWTTVTTPSGSVVGPLLVQGFTHTPMMNVTLPGLTLTVPAAAPAGTYVHSGFIGFLPNPLLEAGFAFDKEAGDGPLTANDDGSPGWRHPRAWTAVDGMSGR